MNERTASSSPIDRIREQRDQLRHDMAHARTESGRRAIQDAIDTLEREFPEIQVAA